jgi:hypothetical protein
MAKHTKQYARGVRKRVGVKPTPGPAEQRERLVLQITRKIHTLTAERAKLARRQKEIAKELKGQRRGLRIALQGDDGIMALARRAAALDEQERHEEALRTDRAVTAMEDRIEDGQARWATTGSTRK